MRAEKGAAISDTPQSTDHPTEFHGGVEGGEGPRDVLWGYGAMGGRCVVLCCLQAIEWFLLGVQEVVSSNLTGPTKVFKDLPTADPSQASGWSPTGVQIWTPRGLCCGTTWAARALLEILKILRMEETRAARRAFGGAGGKH